MVAISALRYDIIATRPTKWAEEWRRRWCRAVGSVHQHQATKELIAFYSDERDPDVRLALQNELEARHNGAAQVLAVCRREVRQHNAAMMRAWRARS